MNLLALADFLAILWRVCGGRLWLALLVPLVGDRLKSKLWLAFLEI